MLNNQASAPLISVVIAAYEAERFIAGALEACLQQTGVRLEVIVVDDCSAKSLEPDVLAAAGGDERVRFIRLDQNQGPAGARNAAFDAARGEYIAILDADDGMKPDRLAVLLALAQDSGADIAVDNMTEVFADDEQRLETPFLSIDGFDEPRQIDLETYMGSGWQAAFNRPLGYLKPLFRRSFVEKHGFRYDTTLKNSEDHYIVAEMLAHGAKMMMTPYAGYYYVRHEASLSYRISAAQAAAIVSAEQAFLARHSDRMSAAEKRISIQRQSELRKVSEFEAIAQALKSKALFRALGLLASNPRTSIGHVRQLLSIGLRKIA
ncbi:MAG: glycosyltransferase [Henriciella sp.]|nr:glycosyltransferase [Henriciella sp.]